MFEVAILIYVGVGLFVAGYGLATGRIDRGDWFTLDLVFTVALWPLFLGILLGRER